MYYLQGFLNFYTIIVIKFEADCLPTTGGWTARIAIAQHAIARHAIAQHFWQEINCLTCTLKTAQIGLTGFEQTVKYKSSDFSL